MQNDLKIHSTVLNIIKKLQPTFQSFRYANKFLPTKQMLNLYNSQILHHLMYAVTIWGSSTLNKTYLQPLFRTQKKIVDS